MLSNIFSATFSLSRPNILVLDSPSTIAATSPFNARKAGILGFSSLCRKKYFALNDDYTLNLDEIYKIIQLNQPFVMYGFTYIIFLYVLSKSIPSEVKHALVNCPLIHGGGWKKIIEHKLSHSDFNALVFSSLGTNKVYNYYGMVEQTGSIYFSCSQGYFHNNMYCSIIPRDITTLQPDFSPGDHPRLAQVLSVLPTSYPGHSILTEDLVSVHSSSMSPCSCGTPGLSFEVVGRLPKSEARGCSDTFAS